jgi:heat shock protein 4
MCSEAFGGKELSTTMNQEESVARGCALQAAILSPLYKVRDFKIEDSSPFGVNISWTGSPLEKAPEGNGEDKPHSATIFASGSPMGLHKMLTFFRKEPFDVKAEYLNPDALLPQTSKELGTYKIELPPQTERKKVKVKAKLTLSGCFAIEGAQLLEECSSDFVSAREESPPVVEVAKDGDTPMPDKKKQEGDAETLKESERPKKRMRRTDLKIVATGKPGLSEDHMQKRIAEENEMQAEMRAIIERDEKKNDLESYIFTMRDRIATSGEYGAFITQADREKFESALMKAEDWFYDNVDATKEQFIEKLTELKSQHGDRIRLRFKEHGARSQLIEALSTAITDCRKAAETQGDKKLIAACADHQAWLGDMKAKQDKLPDTEDPVLLCADMEKRSNELSAMASANMNEETKSVAATEQKPDEAKQTSKPGAVPVEDGVELLD